MLTVKVTGQESIEQLVARLGKEFTQEHAEADLMVAVQPTAQAARSNVGLGPPDVHLRDNIAAAPDRDYAKSQGWLASVAVGSTKVARIGRLFYDSFLEFGTVMMSARPWLRPAFDSTKSGIVSRLTALIRARVISAGKAK